MRTQIKHRMECLLDAGEAFDQLRRDFVEQNIMRRKARGGTVRHGAGKDAGVPAASVLRLSQVVQDQHVAARESILAIQSGDGEVYGVRSPWRFESDDPQVVSAPPRFSQHSADVLKELGYTDSEIVALLET